MGHMDTLRREQWHVLKQARNTTFTELGTSIFSNPQETNLIIYIVSGIHSLFQSHFSLENLDNPLIQLKGQCRYFEQGLQ